MPSQPHDQMTPTNETEGEDLGSTFLIVDEELPFILTAC
jgi:hypothetical protein